MSELLDIMNFQLNSNYNCIDNDEWLTSLFSDCEDSSYEAPHGSNALSRFSGSVPTKPDEEDY